MDANELLKVGKLAEAVEAAIAAVKKKPTDIAARYALAQLLCFSGDLERADNHLDAIGTQEMDRTVIVALQRQLIRGEQWRRQVFAEGRLPDFLAEPTATIKAHLQALISLREGRTVEAVEVLRAGEAERVPVKGTCDGDAFDELRDLDDLTSSFLEVLTSTGKYFWVPFENINRIEFHTPETLFDLVWRPAHLDVADGPDGEVYIPALYVDTYKSADEAIKLGRGTDWTGEDENLVRGIGQRIWLVGETDRPIMEIGELETTRERGLTRKQEGTKKS